MKYRDIKDISDYLLASRRYFLHSCMRGIRLLYLSQLFVFSSRLIFFKRGYFDMVRLLHDINYNDHAEMCFGIFIRYEWLLEVVQKELHALFLKV